VKVETVSGERVAIEIATGKPATIGPIEKISKSKRNGIDPDDIQKVYGADAMRWFILSDSPPERDVVWSEAGIEGATRFIQRVWRIVGDAADLIERAPKGEHEGDAADVVALRKISHRAVHYIGEEIEGLKFNVSVARIYEFVNALAAFVQTTKASPTAARTAALRDAVERLVQVLAPMTPHLAESAWEALGHTTMLTATPWPDVDPALLVDDTVTMPVQVNGKRRGEITVFKGSPSDLVEKEALSLEAVARMLDDKPPKKVVIVPDRIVNVVV
jgi:leucyl-tRNA synthetase